MLSSFKSLLIFLFLFVGMASGESDQKDSIFLYLTIPIVSAFVGWSTNWVALKLVFYPLEFFGFRFLLIKNQPIGLFGWQGIIPAKCAEMASIAVDLITTKLIDVKEVISRIDPDVFASKMRPGLEKTINEVFTEITAEHAGPLWNQLSVEVKGEIFAQAMDRSPSLVSQMMEEIKQDPYYVFDIKGMVVSHLESNKQLINYIFQQCGAKEFKFIEKSGAVLGFIFGLFQAFAWYFYSKPWVLPAAGFLVGYLTNYIALFMIFKPVNERRIS